jgi:hypothetical protein
MEKEAKQGQNFFLLNDYRDMYFKCWHDWKQLHNSDPEEKTYAMFNLIMTLNHLFDWVLKDQNISFEKKIRCIRAFNPYKSMEKVSPDFKEFYDQLPERPPTRTEQYLVRSLSNKAKHLLQTPSTESVTNTVYLGAGSPDAYCNGPKAFAGFHEIIVTHVVGDDGEDYDLKDICTTLIHDWGDFFRAESLFVLDSSSSPLDAERGRTNGDR